mmetsp:Transcript_97910/g.310524  ORF Transcript_97910/g.310524 Transcript_97910/m.310524 type:complete len:371 (-) Transcript_97910:873-1985(-)
MGRHWAEEICQGRRPHLSGSAGGPARRFPTGVQGPPGFVKGFVKRLDKELAKELAGFAAPSLHCGAAPPRLRELPCLGVVGGQCLWNRDLSFCVEGASQHPHQPGGGAQHPLQQHGGFERAVQQECRGGGGRGERDPKLRATRQARAHEQPAPPAAAAGYHGVRTEPCASPYGALRDGSPPCREAAWDTADRVHHRARHPGQLHLHRRGDAAGPDRRVGPRLRGPRARLPGLLRRGGGHPAARRGQGLLLGPVVQLRPPARAGGLQRQLGPEAHLPEHGRAPEPGPGGPVAADDLQDLQTAAHAEGHAHGEEVQVDVAARLRPVCLLQHDDLHAVPRCPGALHLRLPGRGADHDGPQPERVCQPRSPQGR